MEYLSEVCSLRYKSKTLFIDKNYKIGTLNRRNLYGKIASSLRMTFSDGSMGNENSSVVLYYKREQTFYKVLKTLGSQNNVSW